MPVLVERRAVAKSAKVSMKTTAANPQREGLMKRFLSNLLRSLAAVNS